MITKFSVSLEPVAIYIVSYISIPGSWRKFDQLSAAWSLLYQLYEIVIQYFISFSFYVRKFIVVQIHKHYWKASFLWIRCYLAQEKYWQCTCHCAVLQVLAISKLAFCKGPQLWIFVDVILESLESWLDSKSISVIPIYQIRACASHDS